MIEAISRETIEPKYRTRSAYCSINTVRGRIIFSVGATKAFDFKHKKKLLFFFKKNTLYLCQHEGEEGFIISNIHRAECTHSDQVKIDHKGLVRMIKDRFNLSNKTKRFYMQKSEEKHGEYELIEILIHKPIDEIGKY
jgi:hypothetical protein